MIGRTMKLGAALWLLVGVAVAPRVGAQEIVHDAEYYILEAQNRQVWMAEDANTRWTDSHWLHEGGQATCEN